MIYVGMHNISAVNFLTPIGLLGRTGSLVFFPSTVTEEEIELAFEGESYSDFITEHSVGFIGCSHTIKATGEYSQIRLPYENSKFDSGVNFMKYSGEFSTQNSEGILSSFPNTLFYVPKSVWFNSVVKTVISNWATPLVAANLNAVNIVSSGLGTIPNLTYCNALMDKNNGRTEYLANGVYSSGRSYVDQRAHALYFRDPVTADCVRLNFSLEGSNPSSSTPSVQLWAKVDGLWEEAARMENIKFSENLLTFESATAQEWCITFFGSLNSSPNQTSSLYTKTFALGNSNDTRVPKTFVVDKAVFIPGAPVGKYSDPTVEKASPMPAVFLSVGIKGEVDVLSTSMTEGESIPFVEASIRIGGPV